MLLLVFIFGLGFGVRAEAATITSAQSGNWSTTSTWVGGVVPADVDTITIANGHTVTFDSSAPSLIGLTTVEGRLTLDTGMTMSMSGVLTVGNGASKDGQLDFGVGSTLALGVNNLVLNNAKLTSNATSGNWAKVTGGGAISTGAVYTAPKQDIVLSFVSFQNTGAITFVLGGISGGAGLTNQLDLDHDVFSGNGQILFGLGGWTPLATNITVDSCDFRDGTGATLVTYSGASGTASGLFGINNNTFSQISTYKDVRFLNRDGATFRYNVLSNVGWSVDNATTSGGHTVSDNFFTLPTTSTKNNILFSDGEVASTLQNNYFYAAHSNPHQVGSSSSGGSGTYTISGNVFEIVYNGDGSNCLGTGSLTRNVYQNILIGSGSLLNNVGDKTGAVFNGYRNTVYITSDTPYGALWLSENGNYTGDINLYNNLVSGSISISKGAWDNIAPNQTLAYSGYNNFYSVTNNYVDLGFTDDQTTHDLVVDPQFVDATRKLSAWNQSRGDGTDSADNATNYLLAINGFNSITKTQSETPSTNGVTDLNSWVKTGFAPQNSALQATGRDGQDIGAMNVSVPTYTIGGTVSGLSGTVVLQNNGGDNLSRSDNGSFTFSMPLSNGSAYVVTALTQPSGQICTVTNGSGIVAGSNVTNVSISCVDSQPPVLAEVIPVTTPTTDPTPSYAFSSSEAGAISYGGSCGSLTTSASVGNNTIVFNTLSPGTYSNCTITVTDAATNPSASLAVPAFTINTTTSTQNFSHIKTGGFDYDLASVLNHTEEAQWLATHHDLVIGLQSSSFATTIDTEKLPESVYDDMKAANSNVKFLSYIPFNTVLPAMSTYMEAWCTANGRDPEDLYYHYYYDTDVLLRNNSTVTYKGFGGGTATSLTEARVPSAWWSGLYPNINPTSQTFRDAFKTMSLEIATVDSAGGKYTDGLLLDTFDGTTDDYFDLQLQNTIEMIDLGKTEETSARNQAQDDLLEARDEIENHLSSSTGRDSRVIPNAAELDYVFGSRVNLYANSYDSLVYNEMGIEYLVTSIYTSTSRIPLLKDLYDSMENGILYFNNSQTNYGTRLGSASPDDDLTEDEWFGFNQFILATHYLVNHQNGYFSYHRGSAAYYGGKNGSMQTTHWNQNIEYDIGSPVVRSELDYWGENDTDRFFTFADGGATYKIMGREYDDALVLVKFGNVGGWANIGNSLTTHSLGANYRRLQSDNSLGPVVNEITLGFGEGAILIKETSEPTYTIGGTVSGLSGTLVLQNNSGDDETISANGAFTFDTLLSGGASYAVMVLTQPSGQTCAITNGSGAVSSSNVTNISIYCSDNPMDAKAITAFNFNALAPAVTGTINESNHTIALTVPYGTDVTALIPTITITGSSVSPNIGVATNFTNPVTYTVTAANSSIQEYVVTVDESTPPDTTAPNSPTNLSVL